MADHNEITIAEMKDWMILKLKSKCVYGGSDEEGIAVSLRPYGIDYYATLTTKEIEYAVYNADEEQAQEIRAELAEAKEGGRV